MATKTAAQIAQAWQQGMASKASNYSAGIQACQVNPMQLAAAKVDTAVSNYAAAAPRMAAALNATSVGFWKSQSAAAQAKFAAGAAKGMTKYTAAITKMAGGVYQGMATASQAAGGGAQGAAAAITYLQQAKANGQTK